VQEPILENQPAQFDIYPLPWCHQELLIAQSFQLRDTPGAHFETRAKMRQMRNCALTVLQNDDTSAE
jgi:hypothetical protein